MIALLVVSREHGGEALAHGADGLRQLSQGGAIQIVFKAHRVFPAPAALPNGGKKAALDAHRLVLLGRQDLVHLPGGGSRLLHSGGKGLGHLFILAVSSVQNGEGLGAAGHLDSGAAPKVHRVQKLYETDFPCGLHMGAAAGAQVHPGNLHDSHRPGQLLFRPVGETCKFLRVGVPAPDWKILPDIAVDLGLDFRQVLLGYHAVKVDGDAVGPHVKARVVPAVTAVDDAGDHVLSRVGLHPLEPGFPVYGPGHKGSRLQRAVAEVDHFLPPLPGVQDLHVSQASRVSGLTAAFGVEGRGAEGHFIAAFCLPAGQNPGFKLPQMGVFIV